MRALPARERTGTSRRRGSRIPALPPGPARPVPIRTDLHPLRWTRLRCASSIRSGDRSGRRSSGTSGIAACLCRGGDAGWEPDPVVSMVPLDWLWLLLPVAATSGWYAAMRRKRGEKRSSTQTELRNHYFRGVNYLLNEEPDKAIELFIRMLEVDSETVDTHLALGNLYRRRGEVDRAIRIHHNLIEGGALGGGGAQRGDARARPGLPQRGTPGPRRVRLPLPRRARSPRGASARTTHRHIRAGAGLGPGDRRLAASPGADQGRAGRGHGPLLLREGRRPQRAGQSARTRSPLSAGRSSCTAAACVPAFSKGTCGARASSTSLRWKPISGSSRRTPSTCPKCCRTCASASRRSTGVTSSGTTCDT